MRRARLRRHSLKICPFVEMKKSREEKEMWERRPEDHELRSGEGEAKKMPMTPANGARSEDLGAESHITGI